MALNRRILKDKLDHKFEDKTEIDDFDYDDIDINYSYRHFYEVDIRLLPHILKIPNDFLCKTLLYTTLKMILCFCMISNRLLDKDYYVDIIKFRNCYQILMKNIDKIIVDINKYKYFLITERKHNYEQKQLNLQLIDQQKRRKEHLLVEIYVNKDNPHYDTKITRELSYVNKRVNNVRQKMYFIILCLKNEKGLNLNVIKNIINFAFGDIIKSQDIHVLSYEKKGKSSHYHQRKRNENITKILHEEYSNFKSQIQEYAAVLRNAKSYLCFKYFNYEKEYYSI